MSGIVPKAFHVKARTVRAGAMIALAYLFILQGLLAPFVALASPARLDPLLAVLCLDGSDIAGAEHGGPASHHGGDGCCDIGCLPHASAGGSSVAGSPALGFAPPTLRPASRTQGYPQDAPAPAVRPPGSQGPRAPPYPVS